MALVITTHYIETIDMLVAGPLDRLIGARPVAIALVSLHTPYRNPLKKAHDMADMNEDLDTDTTTASTTIETDNPVTIEGSEDADDADDAEDDGDELDADDADELDADED